MVVADNHVYPERASIFHFLHGLYSAVEHNHKFHTRLASVVDTAFRNAVALVVAVGNVIVYVRKVFTQELIDHRYCRTAVHVVIAEHKYPFLAPYGFVYGVYCLAHVVHQERVVQVRQLRPEELLGFCNGSYAAFTQKPPENGVNTQFSSQRLCRRLFLQGGRRVFPFVVHYILSFSFFVCWLCKAAPCAYGTPILKG